MYMCVHVCCRLRPRSHRRPLRLRRVVRPLVCRVTRRPARLQTRRHATHRSRRRPCPMATICCIQPIHGIIVLFSLFAILIRISPKKIEPKKNRPIMSTGLKILKKRKLQLLVPHKILVTTIYLYFEHALIRFFFFSCE